MFQAIGAARDGQHTRTHLAVEISCPAARIRVVTQHRRAKPSGASRDTVTSPVVFAIDAAAAWVAGVALNAVPRNGDRMKLASRFCDADADLSVRLNYEALTGLVGCINANSPRDD